MDINKYIGKEIKKLRLLKNITQEELAEYLHTTAQSISRYEIGERKTNQDILFSLAQYFNVSINDFFPPINTYNPKLKAIEHILKKLNDEDINKIYDYIQLIYNSKSKGGE